MTSHGAHPFGRALVTHFTVAGTAHYHANTYFPADGDLNTLQEILDWVYPYLLLTPARVVVLTGDLNANLHWVPHLPVSHPHSATSSCPRSCAFGCAVYTPLLRPPRG